MFKTDINVKTGSVTGIEWMRAAIKAAEKILKPKKSYRLSVALVPPKEMRLLNKEYAKKNKVTDVLSFAVHRESKGTFIVPKTDESYLGEIVICPSMARDSAKKQGHSQKKELQTLLVHGLLHLLGYKHQRVKDEKKMFTLQEKIIKSIK